MSPEQLSDWNRTEVDYPRDSTIHELFERQVAITPDEIAVISGDRRLTYCELNDLSDRLAARLQHVGVQPETLIGICLIRSEHLVVAILAVLKAGCAYIPLDPKHPRERLAFIIRDSNLCAVISSRETCAIVSDDSSPRTMIDVEGTAALEPEFQAPISIGSSQGLAYVIYTSGSTGRPKGVMVEHRNVVNFFFAMDRAIGSAPGVWLAVTGFGFDISVLELLWTLTRGFTIVIHGEEATSGIAEEIARHSITHLQTTPSISRLMILDSRIGPALASLKQILLGGEAVPAALIHSLRKQFQGEIFNMYGPTETTIWSTTYCVRELGEVVPIGRPVANTQIYLLDEEQRPVAPGETGELFIGGDGVARGYWNAPDLTADRFLFLPVVSSHRIYRTGDLGRMLPDGNIEFLGRVDDQIKLRGNRIEPGEIEAVLEQIPGVRQAVVIAREDREGDLRLAAYLVAEQSGKDAITTLRRMLAEKLPEAMVPSLFEFLLELPLNANGKIDRKALRALPVKAAEILNSSGHSDLPATDIELAVAQAWKEALGVSEVRLNDNFFDLGAHSLTIAEVRIKLERTLGRDISIIDLFQFTTVSSLARHLSSTQQKPADSRLSDRALRRKLARQG